MLELILLRCLLESSGHGDGSLCWIQGKRSKLLWQRQPSFNLLHVGNSEGSDPYDVSKLTLKMLCLIALKRSARLVHGIIYKSKREECATYLRQIYLFINITIILAHFFSLTFLFGFKAGTMLSSACLAVATLLTIQTIVVFLPLFQPFSLILRRV